jgi:hypothetical protein
MSNFKDYIELANEMINEGKKNQNVKKYDKNEKQKYIISLNDNIEKENIVKVINSNKKISFLISSNKEIKNISLSSKKYDPINEFLGLEKDFKKDFLVEKIRTNKKAPFIYKVTFK